MSLSAVEFYLLSKLVERLPEHLKRTVESQFDNYHLVQREVDGRALNFYPEKRGAEKLDLIAMNAEEAPLIRITAKEEGVDEPIHAVLSAVNGRAFCVSLNRRVDRIPDSTALEIVKVTHAWKSNFPKPEATGESSKSTDKPADQDPGPPG